MSETVQKPGRKTEMAMNIEGMHCASCVATIEMSLMNADGVITSSVSLLDEKAIIEYDESRTDREILEKALDSTGYRLVRPALNFTAHLSKTEGEWAEMTYSLESLHAVISSKAFINSLLE